jgi:hypothetical protein
MRLFFFILLIFLSGFSFGQDFVIENLTNNSWASRVKVSDLNINGFKEIGLSKLKVPVDSIKNDVSIWQFRGNELKILNYIYGQGLDTLIVKCSFDYDKNKRMIRIFHFSQDSSFWEYSLGINSIGNYILMTRKN